MLGVWFFFTARSGCAGDEGASGAKLSSLNVVPQNTRQTPLRGRGTSPVASESDPEDALVQKNWQVDLQPPKRPGALGTDMAPSRPPLDVPKGAKRGVGGTHKRTESHVGPHSSRSRRTGIHLSQKRRPFIYILARTTIASV